MHPYLKYLLQDIRKGHREEPLGKEVGQKDTKAHFRDIDRWLSGDAEQTLGYYCELQTSDFPPAGQFAEDEIQQVCQAFEQMLQSWGASLDLPNKIPCSKRYELMVGLLQHEFTPMSTGCFTFDFCTGYAPGCELGTFCPCLEFWNE